MAITELLDPAQMPNQDMDQQIFDNLWAAVLRALPNWGTQANALAANINSLAAGGAYAIPYKFVANVTIAGDLSVDNPAAQSSTATLRVSATSSAGAAVGPTIASFSKSTSAVKGTVLLTKYGDLSKWMRLGVTSVSLNGSYYALAVTLVDSSSANPFAIGDALNLDFTPNGDRGQTGMYSIAKFSERQAPQTSAGSSATLAFTTRALNTIDQNDIGATLSSNQITLPAGTYQVIARSPAYSVGPHRVFLRNMTDGVDLLQGSNAMSSSSTGTQTDSIITGVFTITASKSLALRHWTQNAQASNGLGQGMGYATEIYAEIMLMRIA